MEWMGGYQLYVTDYTGALRWVDSFNTYKSLARLVVLAPFKRWKNLCTEAN